MLSAKLLAEERRLFYVAATRARQRLVVTAAGGEDTDQRPSRFLTELAGDDIPIERVTGGGTHRWLSLPALVADLRRAAADTARPPARPPGRGRAAGQAGRRRGPRGAPAGVVRADRAVRGRPDRGGRGGRPAVPVPGRVVHPVRFALATGGGGRRGPVGCAASPGHGHPRRGGAGRVRRDRAGRGRPDRRDLAPPGLRQRLVQRQAAGAGRADGPQVPRLARRQPARAGRGGAAVQGPDRPGGDHGQGGQAGVRSGRAARSWST